MVGFIFFWNIFLTQYELIGLSIAIVFLYFQSLSFLNPLYV